MCQPTGSFSTLVSGLFQYLLVYQCSLVDENQWPADVTNQILDGDSYDIIVIGAGCSGSLIANRLSENPTCKVLIIEPGGDPPADSAIPGLSHALTNTDADWGFQTETSCNACLGSIGKKCQYSMGKMLGGSGSMGSMLYVRPNKNDFDSWKNLGNDGWDYNCVLPYFKKSENLDDEKLKKKCGTLKYHGVGGPLNVGRFNYTHHLHNVVMRAGKQIGHKINKDVNGECQLGFTKLHGMLKDGTRQSTATAFLQSAKNRPNLDMIKGASVQKILIVNKKVVGVIINTSDNRNITINCTKEVILSAGTFFSPQMLILSGIGPTSLLNTLGITSVANLAVGSNLQEQVSAWFTFTWPRTTHCNAPNHTFSTIASYIEHKTGPLVRGQDSAAFIKTKGKCQISPDIQLTFTYADDVDTFKDIFSSFGYNSNVTNGFNTLLEQKNILLVSVKLLQPKSLGQIILNSKDPSVKPIIKGNFLENPEDIDTIIRGIREAVKLGNTKAFRDHQIVLDKIEYAPCDMYKFGCDCYWKCMVKHMSTVSGSAVGSCKMGPASDPNSVVDSGLKVHGITGLRIVDSSVLPGLTTGDTSTTLVMMAEKISDMIKADWNL